MAYYWDMVNGDDISGDGTEGSPWQYPPLHPSYNSVTTTPVAQGDTHYIKGWVIVPSNPSLDTLIATAEAHRVTFQRWPGETDRWGFDLTLTDADWLVLGNWTETSTGSNVWYVAADSTFDATKRLLVDTGTGLRGWGMESLTDETGIDPDVRRYWHHDGTTYLYVYATANPASLWSDIRVVATSRSALAIHDTTFATIDGMHVRGGTNGSVYGYIGDVSSVVRDGVILNDCYVDFCGWNGIRFRSPLQRTSYWANPLVTNSEIDTKMDPTEAAYPGDGVPAVGSEAEDSGDGFYFDRGVLGGIVRGCVARNFGHTNYSLAAVSADHETSPATYGVRDCLVEDCESYGNVANWGRPFAVSGFDNDETLYGAWAKDNVFRRIKSFYHSVRPQIQGDGTRVEACEILQTSGSTVYVGERLVGNGEGISAAEEGDGDVTGVVVENLSIHECNDAGLRVIATATEAPDITFRNIKIYNCGLAEADATMDEAIDTVLELRQPSGGAGFASVNLVSITAWNDSGNHLVKLWNSTGNPDTLVATYDLDVPDDVTALALIVGTLDITVTEDAKPARVSDFQLRSTDTDLIGAGTTDANSPSTDADGRNYLTRDIGSSAYLPNATKNISGYPDGVIT